MGTGIYDSTFYSQGVLLYKICYLRTPFEGQGKLSILAAKISFPPDTFPNQPFNRIIRACLRVDQSKRPGILQILDICTALMSGKVK